MTYKDLMIKSLTDLLEDGETLMHPVYGVLDQGNEQYYGYFGFTESHLLIALVSGKQITDTIRIPLDIRSVRIKQTAVLKQYVVDISFNDGVPCKITASPRVLLIDSQKDNVPQFLKYLKSRSPEDQAAELKDIRGPKIRWQYVNPFLYVMLAFSPMPTVVMIITGLKENSLDLAGMTETVLTALIIWGMFLLPVIVLSVLNRFCFGKIVSVVSDDGLFLENDFIQWKEIKKITFHPRISSRVKASYTYATVFVAPAGKTEYSIDVMHFPAYGLRKIKAYAPEINIEFGKAGVAAILFIALMPTFVSVILSLGM